MPASKRPRRSYRPRAINAPVTGGLVQMFEECLAVAETGLLLRAPTAEHFDAIGTVLNVIGPCTMARLGKQHPLTIAMVSAALSMNAAADRAAAKRKAGRPDALERMYDHELAAVSRGIDAAREALPLLDVRSLATQRQRLLLTKVEEVLA